MAIKRNNKKRRGNHKAYNIPMLQRPPIYQSIPNYIPPALPSQPSTQPSEQKQENKTEMKPSDSQISLPPPPKDVKMDDNNGNDMMKQLSMLSDAAYAAKTLYDLISGN